MFLTSLPGGNEFVVSVVGQAWGAWWRSFRVPVSFLKLHMNLCIYVCMYMYIYKESTVHCLNQLLNRRSGELLHCPSCEDSLSLWLMTYSSNEQAAHSSGRKGMPPSHHSYPLTSPQAIELKMLNQALVQISSWPISVFTRLWAFLEVPVVLIGRIGIALLYLIFVRTWKFFKGTKCCRIAKY